eukprot:945351_1
MERENGINQRFILPSSTTFLIMAARNVDPHNLKHEYFHVLNSMSPCGQSNIIDRYIEEAKQYQIKTQFGPLKEVHAHNHTNRGNDQGLRTVENQIIQILEGILNDGALSFDVAFCRLIIILPYVQPCVLFALECVTFFVY